MSKPELRKVTASDALEEVLNLTSKQSSQNWLLSYLDVFVLVVMLMVTLVSIGDFSHKADLTAQQAKTADTIKRLKARLQAANQELFLMRAEKRLVNVTPPPTIATPSPVPQPSIDVDDAGQARAQQQLNEKVKRLGLAAAVNMTVGKGFAQFDMQDKVLFESSTAELTLPGKELLSRLLPLLKESEGMIIIEGHTDNRPIKHRQYASNWELSGARATGVLHYLTSQHIPAERLRAISYADTKPIGDNNTKTGREKNRRVNIVIQLDNKPQSIVLE